MIPCGFSLNARPHDQVATIEPRSQWPLQTVLAIHAQPTATPCARLHARHVLGDWGLSDMADTVELVVSELVTNAVQAAMAQDGHTRRADDRDPACVQVRLASDRLETLVEVWDNNGGLPSLNQPTVEDEGGRGLMLVAALSKQPARSGAGTGPLMVPAKLSGRLSRVDRRSNT